MSNKLNYFQIIQDWEAYLKEHPNNFIRIKDIKGNRWLNFPNQDRPSNLRWETVLATHTSLVPFMDALIKKEMLTNILVQFKRTNGTGSKYDLKRQQGHFDVSSRINSPGLMEGTKQNPPSFQQLEQPQEAFKPQPTTQPQPQHHAPNNYEREVMQHMGGLGAAGLAAGLGFRDLLTLERKAEQSDFYKTEMDRLRKDVDVLQIENRKLQSQVTTAEKEKDLAIKETQLAAKSWSDPDSIKAILENLGPVASQLLARNQGQAPQQLGMGASNDLSEAKKNFIGYLTDEMVTDERVRLLEGILVMMVQNKDFEKKLSEMINNLHTNVESPGT